MKALKWTIAALGAALAQSAAAQSPSQWYAGASIGQSSFDPSNNSWQTGGASTSYDDTDMAWKLFAGYRFHRYFGIEGGYTDLGEYKARVVPNAAPANAGEAKVKVNSWNLALVGYAPVAPTVNLFGKAGFTTNNSEMTFSSNGGTFLPGDSGHDSRSQFYWGLGGSFTLTKQIALRAEYENFGKAGKSNDGMTTANRTGESQPYLFSVGLQFSM